MRLTFKQFHGIAPFLHPTKLREDGATICDNVNLLNDALNGFHQSLFAPGGHLENGFNGDPPSTIWRKDNTYWFAFGDDTDVSKGLNIGDSLQRVYWTNGDGFRVQKYADAVATPGSGYPSGTSRAVGVYRPTDKPTGTPSGGTPPTLQARVYCYTYVNDWGEESAPSPFSDYVPYADGDTITLTNIGPISLSTLPYKNIYRSISGTDTTADFMIVATIPASDASYADTVPDTALSGSLGYVYNEMPPTNATGNPSTLRGLLAHPNHWMLGFVGNYVYQSKPNLPHAWPSAFARKIPSEIVGLAVVRSTVMIMARDGVWALSGQTPDGSVTTKIGTGYGCVSKRSIVTVGDYVYYASDEGLVRVGVDGQNVVTFQGRILDQAQWGALNPSSMFGCEWYGGVLMFHLTDSGDHCGFWFNPADRSFMQFVLPAAPTAIFLDQNNRRVYWTNLDQNIMLWDGSPDSLLWRWQSKAISLPHKSYFGVVRVLADSYDDLRIKITASNDADTESAWVTVIDKPVTSDAHINLPLIGRYRFWRVQPYGYDQVLSIDLASDAGELA